MIDRDYLGTNLINLFGELRVVIGTRLEWGIFRMPDGRRVIRRVYTTGAARAFIAWAR